MIVFSNSYYHRKKRFIRRNPKIYLQTPKIKPRPEIPAKKIIIYTLVIVFLGGIFYLIFISGYLVINKIVVIGNKNILYKNIEESLNPILNRNILSKNILFFNSKEAVDKLSNDFREIKEIQIKKRLPSKIEIIIQERIPVLCWQTNKIFYLIDEEGLVLKELGDKNNSKLPLINDLSNQKINIDEKKLSISFIKFIQKLHNDFNPKTSLNIDTINIEETTFEIEVKTKEGFSVYLDTSRDLDIQLKNLVKILETVKKEGKIINNLEYVDLRLRDKLFYKYK